MLQILMFSFNINLVMGVGFNSIYHITDSPSFITGDKYVILDPHKWYYEMKASIACCF